MKVLLVCESTSKHFSGGRVVRYLAKILNENNIQLMLTVLAEKTDETEGDSFYKTNETIFIPIRKNLQFRIANLFFRTKEINQFNKILNTFSPDIVHFASFDIDKPAQFIKSAKIFGAKVVLQPWTMRFFCAQGFGFREGEICTLCANGNYSNAFTKRCVTYRGIPSLLERKILHKHALSADVLLSSNNELDKILLDYGVKESKLVRFPVPFDYTFLSPQQIEEKNDFIYFGQPNSHKGLNVLLKIFKLLPELKLKLYPLSYLQKSKIKNENIEVINGIGWSNGLEEAIASTKTILIPSLWSTSTEYAMCEALLFKKPVVLFNVGVHKDIFINKHNAIVIEPNDLETFANEIIELNQNIELRRSIGENGYRTLLEINNPNKLYSQLLQAYTYENFK